MSANEDSEFSTAEGSEMSGSEDSDSDSDSESESESEPNTPEDNPELRCNCGLVAKKRISRTPRNYMRPFFNCRKPIDDQCGFFQWADELYETDSETEHFEELNSKCGKCHKLYRRIYRIRTELDEGRAAWNREKRELETQLSTLKSELDQMKKRIKLANESELMPPLDKLSKSDDEADDIVVKHVV